MKEASPLERLLNNGRARMPAQLARYLLTLGFDEDDRRRMEDVALYEVRRKEWQATDVEIDAFLERFP